MKPSVFNVSEQVRVDLEQIEKSEIIKNYIARKDRDIRHFKVLIKILKSSQYDFNSADIYQDCNKYGRQDYADYLRASNISIDNIDRKKHEKLNTTTITEDAPTISQEIYKKGEPNEKPLVVNEAKKAEEELMEIRSNPQQPDDMFKNAIDIDMALKSLSVFNTEDKKTILKQALMKFEELTPDAKNITNRLIKESFADLPLEIKKYISNLINDNPERYKEINTEAKLLIATAEKLPAREKIESVVDLSNDAPKEKQGTSKEGLEELGSKGLGFTGYLKAIGKVITKSYGWSKAKSEVLFEMYGVQEMKPEAKNPKYKEMIEKEETQVTQNTDHEKSASWVRARATNSFADKVRAEESNQAPDQSRR